MHDEHSTPHSTEHSEKLGYEDSDVSLPILLKWGFGLAVFVGGTSVIVLLVYMGLAAINTRGSGAAFQRPTLSADVPRLQADPEKDIKKFRADERTRLTHYGTWKDGDGKDAKFIPLERAMQIVEAKGLPIETAESAKDDVTPPAEDRGFVDNPLPDGTQPPVNGKIGPQNGDSMDTPEFGHHTPGM